MQLLAHTATSLLHSHVPLLQRQAFYAAASRLPPSVTATRGGRLLGSTTVALSMAAANAESASVNADSTPDSVSLTSSDALNTLSDASETPIESALAVSNSTLSSTQNTSVFNMSPRVTSVFFMSLGMCFHFSGYEFIRNSCLALFTSSQFGFASATSWAFPLANALVSPFSIGLLWIYGTHLLRACQVLALPRKMTLALVGFIFLFQNSYQYLIYTQQWSFLSSVLTPDEGSKWFSRIAGFSSMMCGLFGTLVPYMLPVTGLLGLLATTCITLTAAMLCQDKAYALAQTNGFDPAEQMMAKSKKKKEAAAAASLADPSIKQVKESKWTEAKNLFQRVPTLRALMSETLTFQSLNNILNVAFVIALKETITNDHARSAYTGRFYAATNIISASLQFLIVPMIMKYAEAKWIWRLMPLVPLTFLLGQITQANLSLSLLAAAFGLAKIMDYAMRNVVYPMAYQPLDFESRYVGKEIIGVLGSRFGKSGMSLFLSGLTGLFGSAFGVRQLIYLAFGSSGAWMGSTWWLSSMLPKQSEAEAIVANRNQKQKEEKAEEERESKKTI
jgi:cadmium resistance protein CadD (predicted permease)